MRPWNSEPRWRYLHRRPAQQGKQTRPMKIIRSISRKMGSQGLNRVPVKRKIRRCTQLCFRIKYSASTIPFYFMKFTIAMRYAKKIISTLSKCNDRMPTITKSYTRQHQRCRRNLPNLTKEALIHHLSILNIQSWSLIARALILLGPSISQAVEIVQWCPQTRLLRNVDFSQMQLTTLLSQHLILNRILNSNSRLLAWTITRTLVCRHRDFVGSQIFYKVPGHHK